MNYEEAGSKNAQQTARPLSGCRKVDVLEYSGPGNPYHYIEVTIERRKTGRWRVECIESWGQDREVGYQEEHGRNEFVGMGRTLDEAVHDAQQGVATVGFDLGAFSRALSEAVDDVEEELEGE